MERVGPDDLGQTLSFYCRMISRRTADGVDQVHSILSRFRGGEGRVGDTQRYTIEEPGVAGKARTRVEHDLTRLGIGIGGVVANDRMRRQGTRRTGRKLNL